MHRAVVSNVYVPAERPARERLPPPALTPTLTLTHFSGRVIFRRHSRDPVLSQPTRIYTMNGVHYRSQ